MHDKLDDITSKHHNPFELAKEVQRLYGMVFNELVRQVSTYCVERGQLMSKARSPFLTSRRAVHIGLPVADSFYVTTIYCCVQVWRRYVDLFRNIMTTVKKDKSVLLRDFKAAQAKSLAQVEAEHTKKIDDITTVLFMQRFVLLLFLEPWGASSPLHIVSPHRRTPAL
jgi:hypothetical protein